MYVHIYIYIYICVQIIYIYIRERERESVVLIVVCFVVLTGMQLDATKTSVRPRRCKSMRGYRQVTVYPPMIVSHRVASYRTCHIALCVRKGTSIPLSMAEDLLHTVSHLPIALVPSAALLRVTMILYIYIYIYTYIHTYIYEKNVYIYIYIYIYIL